MWLRWKIQQFSCNFFSILRLFPMLMSLRVCNSLLQGNQSQPCSCTTMGVACPSAMSEIVKKGNLQITVESRPVKLQNSQKHPNSLWLFSSFSKSGFMQFWSSILDFVLITWFTVSMITLKGKTDETEEFDSCLKFFSTILQISTCRWGVSVKFPYILKSRKSFWIANSGLERKLININ